TLELDYSERDTQLVGIVSAYVKQHLATSADVSVRLLTHDTGPIATANGVGVPILPVPDEWLLPPEPNEKDKRIATLESEVAHLKQTEPQFTIACVNESGQELEGLQLHVSQYNPLSPTPKKN